MKPKYALLLSALVSAVFYYLTCFRTFTWWDSSEYSIAALTLGVPHPPGSLLTVLIGWLATRLPLGIDKFFLLNLVAALMAAIAVYIVGRIALLLLENKTDEIETGTTWLVVLAVALAALFFGLTHTMWYYAIRFTPYMTTALLTALILLSIVLWIRKLQTPDSNIYFGLITLLFGVDFSIHRTNLLMLPGLIVWLLLFFPGAFKSVKYYIYGIGGLFLGLAVQLILIPIAAGKPFINFNDPSNFPRFWDYITLKQYGGGWLINMFPRKAPFWSTQVTDYLSDFANNFASNSMSLLGYLPLVLGIVGLILLFRKNWRLGLGLSVMFILSSLGAIIYFNLPENFFRSIDRHYLPSFVIFGLFVVYGAGAIIRNITQWNDRRHLTSTIISLALIILLPLQAIARNYHLIDGSKSYFAYDTAHNYLDNLPENAILFTQADIDTYPLWCLQIAENYRRDITICNMSLMNTPWFFDQILAQDSTFPYRPAKREIESFSVIPWQDSVIAIDVSSQKPASEYNSPDSIRLTVPPSYGGKYILVQDQVLWKTIQADNWKRPICFSSLLSDQSLSWLKQYLRMDGLYRTLVNNENVAAEYEILRQNLMDNYSYRGYMDNNLTKEEPTQWIGWNLCGSFLTLASMQYSAGDTAGCAQTINKLNTVIPATDIGAPRQLLDAINRGCK